MKYKKYITPDKHFILTDENGYCYNFSPKIIKHPEIEKSYIDLLNEYNESPKDFKEHSIEQFGDVNGKISFAIYRLKRTDFVIAKFVEEVLINQSISREDFISKWKKVLDKRKEAREYLKSIGL
ncbi:MAG: hypothetical protein LBQ37_02430 [Elusimicrobiota bacterium]|jgi:hypothetical protein|nr:hypothetical protein [Elusimicrobiota bacterium]